jgi:hypothetical protein
MSEEMSEELFDLFVDAIEDFPEDQREPARKWFAQAQACMDIVEKLQNGIMP